jgi:hypothetical protein
MQVRELSTWGDSGEGPVRTEDRVGGAWYINESLNTSPNKTVVISMETVDGCCHMASEKDRDRVYLEGFLKAQ